MALVIPNKFKELLKNSVLESDVESSMKPFVEIYKDNKLFFFEDYTDHGISHINQVLSSGESLISEESFKNLSAEDIAAFILSVMLHDIGMHLHYEGFHLLLKGNFDHLRINEFDNKTWKQEWNKFIDTAKKFNQEELSLILGDDWDSNKSFDFKTIEAKSKNDLTGHDKKIIGEFIRRHHARLAHEIALAGFPGPELLPFAINIDKNILNVSGLIARSHNLNIRDTFSYLKIISDKSWRNPFNIKAIYLMVLLRVSDYIQIQPDRASKKILKFRSLTNLFSRLEWDTHESISQIDSNTEDPEAIFINCQPKTSRLFLKLSRLFNDIQYELDLSWAILGEVYGGITNLENLKIRYRRISSNLDNIESFEKQSSYIPREAKFRSDPSLLNLLIGPLYGDNPTYGVRELLQNAIDACREREYSESTKDYKSEIKISIDQSEEASFFIISDNGIGMDAGIVINYFLKSGASFRDSMNWKQRFTNNKGESEIERSGRFGVGVLAAYLIGNEIDVITKRVDAPYGLCFKASINSTQVEINKVVNLEKGTTIKIKLHPDTLKILMEEWRDYCQNKKQYNLVNWPDWFYGSRPSVVYDVPKTFEKPNEGLRKTYPDHDDSLPIEMQAIAPSGYHKVLWWYEKDYIFLCNGITIPKSYRLELSDYYSRREYPTIERNPSISIFDFNANLPLKLDRNELNSNTLPFTQELALDIYKDIIAWILIFKDPTRVEKNKIAIHKFELEHPCQLERFGNKRHSKSLIFSEKGFTLLHSYTVESLNIDELISLWINNKEHEELKLKIKTDNKFFLVFNENIKVIGNFNACFDSTSDLEMQVETERLLYLPVDQYLYLFKDKVKRVRAGFKNSFQLLESSNNWACLSESGKINNPLDHSQFSSELEAIEFIKVTSIFEPDQQEDIILEKLLKEYLGEDPIIPFDLKERKKKFPKAFRELGSYMEKYQKK